MSSIWAKGCMLMIECVLSDLTRLPLLAGGRKSRYIITVVYSTMRWLAKAFIIVTVWKS